MGPNFFEVNVSSIVFSSVDDFNLKFKKQSEKKN